ncbi:MAG TPA: VCBS repeat-containing protein [Tepidisphaeraceae bacterium]
MVPAGVLVGPDAGTQSEIQAYSAATGGLLFNLAPYGSPFAPGIRVGSGDINGDGLPDFASVPGPGSTFPLLPIGNMNSTGLAPFVPYGSGGTYVAIGDVNHDTKGDIVTGPDTGTPPNVKVFSGLNGSVLSSFNAYDPAFTGGVRVAVGDINGDSNLDIVTGPGPGATAGSNIKVFSGATLPTVIRSFDAFPAGFTGGVYVAAGDVNGDQVPDIVVGQGDGASVKIFDGVNSNLLANFFAYSAAFTGGVRVAAGDVNGDGDAEVIVAPGSGGGPVVKVFDFTSGGTLSPTLLNSFNVYDPAFTGGVFVAYVPPYTVPEPAAVALIIVLPILHRRVK